MRTNDRIQFEIVKQLIQFCLRVDDRVFAVFKVDVHESMRIKTTIRSHPLFWMIGSIEVYNDTTIKIELLQTSQENSRARIRKWTKRSCNIVINFDSNCDQVNEFIEGTNKHLQQCVRLNCALDANFVHPFFFVYFGCIRCPHCYYRTWNHMSINCHDMHFKIDDQAQTFQKFWIFAEWSRASPQLGALDAQKKSTRRCPGSWVSVRNICISTFVLVIPTVFAQDERL